MSVQYPDVSLSSVVAIGRDIKMAAIKNMHELMRILREIRCP